MYFTIRNITEIKFVHLKYHCVNKLTTKNNGTSSIDSPNLNIYNSFKAEKKKIFYVLQHS